MIALYTTFQSNKKKVWKSILLYILAMLLIWLLFILISFLLFSGENVEYTAFAPILILLIVPMYFRQFHYSLRIYEDSIQIQNDVNILNLRLYWREIDKIFFTPFGLLGLHSKTGRVIYIRKIVGDFVKACTLIVLNAQSNCPSITIDEKSKKRMQKYGIL